MIDEIRQAVRSLLRARGLCFLVVLTLALGIGASTAIFTVANTLLLRPLPYHDPGSLVFIWGNFLKLKIEHLPAKVAEYVDYEAQKDVFSQTAAFRNQDFTLEDNAAPERLVGARITESLFPVLGIQSAIGRSFTSQDCVEGRDRVVILGHNLWQREFSGDRSAIGKTLTLDGEKYEIVGVTSPEFVFPHPSFPFAEPAELWTPLSFSPQQVAERSGGYELNVIGRLEKTVLVEQARAAMRSLGLRMEESYRGYRGPNGEDGGWRINVVSFQEEVAGRSRYAVLVLLAISALVLLIACANVVNLLLLRSTSRRREMATRIALGASRGRIVRQLLTESLILAAAGGAVGLLFSIWSLEVLVAISPKQLPRFGEISLDSRVLSFALFLSMFCGLLCGLVPALQSFDGRLSDVMRQGSSGDGVGASRLRKLLVACQVAIAMCVLVSAGLLLKSFALLQMVDPGLKPQGVLTFNIAFSDKRYSSRERISAFCEDALRRISALPGVDVAGLSSVYALSGAAIDDPFSIEGSPLDLSRLTIAGHQTVSPGFFKTLGIPLVNGRDFRDTDIAGSPEVAIINQQMANRFFAGEDAVGRRIKVGAPQAPGAWATVVGVVKDIPHRRIDSNAEPDWYLPQSQVPRRYLTFFIRTSRDPLSLAPEVRNAITSVDPQQPITNLRTMEDAIGQTLAPRRFSTILTSLFAVVALLLSVSGIYSVVSYAMQRRRREIGVRVALGAQRLDVLKLALLEAMVPALVGLTIGLALSLSLARFLRSLIFGLTVYDPLTFASIGLLLGLLAFLACYVPARRASGIDPLAALRYE